MQALRLARPRLPLRSPSRACAAGAASAHAPAASSSSAVIPLSNVEAMWGRLTADEQLAIHQQLEEVQKKDWKTLSVDEKKAGACPSPLRRVASLPGAPFLLTGVSGDSVLRRVWPARPSCAHRPPGHGPQDRLRRVGAHPRRRRALLLYPRVRCVSAPTSFPPCSDTDWALLSLSFSPSAL